MTKSFSREQRSAQDIDAARSELGPKLEELGEAYHSTFAPGDVATRLEERDKITAADEYIEALEAVLGIEKPKPKLDVTNIYGVATAWRGEERCLAILNTNAIMQKISMADAPVLAAWLVVMSMGHMYSADARKQFLEILDAVEAT